jgi:hypothetical protein
MRRVVIACVLLACGSLAVAQDNTDRSETPPQQGGSWFTWLWSSGDKPAPKTAAAREKKTGPPVVAIRHTREEVILNRRNEVILKLREIAQRTGDDALLRKADELQERAWDLYLQKTAGPADNPPEERR